MTVGRCAIEFIFFPDNSSTRGSGTLRGYGTLDARSPGTASLGKAGALGEAGAHARATEREDGCDGKTRCVIYYFHGPSTRTKNNRSSWLYVCRQCDAIPKSIFCLFPIEKSKSDESRHAAGVLNPARYQNPRHEPGGAGMNPCDRGPLNKLSRGLEVRYLISSLRHVLLMCMAPRTSSSTC